jgi:hypothetical protein
MTRKKLIILKGSIIDNGIRGDALDHWITNHLS